MKYLVQFEKWLPWRQDEPEELSFIVESEIESNNNIVLVAHRIGRYIQSKTIIIPLFKGEKIIVRKIGRKSQIKKGNEEIDIDRQDFTRYWSKCIEKKYKFIWK